jgi:hypothetical protein
MAVKRGKIVLKQGLLNQLSGTNGFITISKNGIIRMSKSLI